MEMPHLYSNSQINIIWHELDIVHIAFGKSACPIFKIFQGVIEKGSWCQPNTTACSKLPEEIYEKCITHSFPLAANNYGAPTNSESVRVDPRNPHI